jgi:RimJ/RimL family protein N-acetyltransferase
MDNAAMFGAVFQDNPASAKVLTHCGFEYLGDAETFSVSRDKTIPTWTYTRKLNVTK